MVLHGSDEGHLIKYGLPDDYVFDHTFESLRQLDIGEGEIMPTLAEVLQLLKQAPKMVINIELKAPWVPATLARYDYKRACQIVKEHIERFQVAERTMISAFQEFLTKQM